MKRVFKFFCAFGLVAALILMGAAMVLPHAHTADMAQHACWICHSKAVGVAAPESAPAPVVSHPIARAIQPVQPAPQTKPVFYPFTARAPPVSSPVLS